MEKKVIVIIPAFNEEDNILSVYRSLMKFNDLNDNFYDVIVINDCSQDNTLKVCHDNDIPVVNLIHNLGIGGAVQTGYQYAQMHDYDIAIQFDGDGQHDAEYLPFIIQPILNDVSDFVIGSRFIDSSSSEFKSSKSRRIGITVISWAIKFATGKIVKDTTSGFRAVNKSIIREFSISYPSEYPEPITTTELLKRGYRLKEIPVSMNERAAGESSIKAWKTVYYMINVILTIAVIKMRRYTHVK